MNTECPSVGCLVLVSVTSSFLAVAPTVTAGSLDECAERVIRDWYSGGRVDGVYPLPCYRAAIRALPDDVLQYSDADRDIARALEYAPARSERPGQRAARAGPRRGCQGGSGARHEHGDQGRAAAHDGEGRCPAR